MEYHFTGTGDSPDFTFIADSIVDSVGNRIFYSTIKNTKIKVKSNTTVFLITTVVEGVKSEHSYSVQKSDEEALKAAIAEIGLNAVVTEKPKLKIQFKKKDEEARKAIIAETGLNVAVTKKSKLKIQFKKKMVVVLLILVLTIGSGIAWSVNANNEKIRTQKEAAVNTITGIAESYGLENVSVELRDFSYDGYEWYYADVTCSNWGQLAPRQMLNTYQRMDDEVDSVRPRVGKKKWVSLGDIYSDGDTYVIYASTNTVKKNRDTIYDDYEHSESHLSASKRGSSSASSTKPSTTAGSSNKDSYGHTKGDAFAIAEKAVKGNLKSPSTAKFCSVTEATIGCSGNTWVVRGWVDAQNGFGATVRTQFAVTFTFASKDMYSLDSCIVT